MPIPKKLPFVLAPNFPVSVHLWEIEETVDELVALLPDSSVLVQPPYVNFKSTSRQKEWLAVRALLAQAVNPSVSIIYNEHGRPFLSPRLSECSVSHTKGYAALALSSKEVGMDIEQISGRAYRLTDHFLQDEEMALVEMDNPETMAVLLWSAKESVYKLYDIEGLELKSDIRLTLETADQPFRLLVNVTGTDRHAEVLGYVTDEYVLTIATFL